MSRDDATLRIGSRGSKLALAQANQIAGLLRASPAAPTVEIVVISTKGDRLQHRPLPEIGGKGLFTAELETALRDGSIDLAVHSLKDLPTDLPDGMTLGAVPEREDPRDVLVSRANATCLDELPEGCRLGTSSLRRGAQVKAARPDIDVVGLRGNVDTRLRKVDEGEVDAAILAAAGLRRLGLLDRATAVLDPVSFVPAPGQGALGIEIREGDERVAALVGALDHAPSRATSSAERALLAALGGGCRVPIAAHAVVVDGAGFHLDGLVAAPDGSRVVRAEGDDEEPDALGAMVAEALAAIGARELLESC